MKIAIEGCAHGELEKIYETIAELEQQNGVKVDLLICCGDFQSTRNLDDLECMAIPKKHHDICTFYKYYGGEKKAPMLTIFIGGNHEASNYLQELPYGGWVAPNIFYLGYAGVVEVNGIRIAGLSGIFKGHDYFKGHFESAPYSEDTKRSVYHQRQLEAFRLSQLQPGEIDICLSHDWPRGVTAHGNEQQLIKFKPYFREDIEKKCLGSKPCEELLVKLKPKYWFSAHLHCKFSAIVPHADGSETRFLALDKCLPKRRFLQILDVEEPEDSTPGLHYDLEWLTILSLTNHLLNVKPTSVYMPGPNGKDRYIFHPTAEDKVAVLEKFDNELKIPENFAQNSPVYDPLQQTRRHGMQQNAQVNMQTTEFCEKLGVDDPLSLVLLMGGKSLNYSTTSQDTNLTFNETFESSTTSFSGTPPEASNLPLWVEDKNPDKIDLDDEEDDDKLVEAFTAKYSTPLKEISGKYTTPRSKLVLPSPKFEDTEVSEKPSTAIEHQESSASKKFKRRNQDIYSTPSE